MFEWLNRRYRFLHSEKIAYVCIVYGTVLFCNVKNLPKKDMNQRIIQINSYLPIITTIWDDDNENGTSSNDSAIDILQLTSWIIGNIKGKTIHLSYNSIEKKNEMKVQ